MAPEGLFKACPPAACTIARPDLPARLWTPADLRSTPVRGRGFAAYLPGYARQLLSIRCAHYAGGASLTTFGVVTIVPRYLLPQVMPSHSFAALTALVVRRVKGDVALSMYRVSGLGDQPKLACTSRRATPKGVERAPGSGTLPPALPGGALACVLGSGTLPLNIPCSMRNVTRPGPFLFLKTNACQGGRVPPPAVPP